jgi:sulfate adenylyltransferase subunit 2
VTRTDQEELVEMSVRYRTVGDMTCTGAVESTATSLTEVIEEVSVSRITERGATRLDDKARDDSMEWRKRGGYF